MIGFLFNLVIYLFLGFMLGLFYYERYIEVKPPVCPVCKGIDEDRKRREIRDWLETLSNKEITDLLNGLGGEHRFKQPEEDVINDWGRWDRFEERVKDK